MVHPIPEGYTTVTPYLTISGAAKAIEFYKQAFGAEELMRMESPDGRIGHAEIRIGDSRIMMSDEWPEMDAQGPAHYGGTPIAVLLYVEDVDAVVERALTAGATVLQPVTDHFYGDRMGTIRDPFGHKWHIGTHIEDVPPDEMKKRAEAMFSQGS
ncbi:MAG: VOC family protein [Rhodospirillaceae bacterium]